MVGEELVLVPVRVERRVRDACKAHNVNVARTVREALGRELALVIGRAALDAHFEAWEGRRAKERERERLKKRRQRARKRGKTDPAGAAS